MPYKLFKKLGLGEPKPTRMSIQLACRLVKYPRGVIEDVLLQIDKFIFLLHFVILDIDEDIKITLIVGQPFLATSKVVINVSDGRLVLKVRNEEVIFKISDAMRHSLEQDNTCYFFDDLYIIVSSTMQEFMHNDPFELCLVQAKEEREDDPIVIEQIAYLEDDESMI